MLNICILDDNKEEAYYHKKLLIDYFYKKQLSINIMDIFTCGKQLLHSNIKYDMLFIDIEIGEENGIEIAKELRKTNQDLLIVIITSYAKYSIQGYKIQAARYLLKPLNPALLHSELDEIIGQLNDHSIILTNQRGDLKRISIQDIYYFETDKRKTCFYVNNTIYSSDHNVTYWYNQLKEDCFYECHKGIFVNIKHIENIGKEDITLSNDVTLPLARRRADTIKEAWTSFFEDSI